MLKTALHCHLGRTIGLGLFFVSTLAYRSQNHDVFGLWSWPYMVIIVTAGFLFLWSAAHSWLCSRQMPSGGAKPTLGATCRDIAILLWGIGYAINGFEAPRNWGQIADLNVVGSSSPLAVLLLWGALFTTWVSLAETIVPLGRGSKLGSVMVAAWVTVVVVLLTEGALRAHAVLAPEPQGYPTYTTALWARKYAPLNQLGFRDADHSLLKPHDTHRLLIVGDSLAFGWGVKRMEDRFGEQLGQRLREQTAADWEVLNASLGDTDTLTHIQFLHAVQRYQPDVILLLYAFNDIDYVVPVTPREGPSEHMTGLRDRLSPVRLLFTNLFLFQDFYVRLRMLAYQAANTGEEASSNDDPYNSDAILMRHFHDLGRFVTQASESGAIVAIVPFDIKVTGSSALRRRYEHFVRAASAYGLPIWPVGEDVFMPHAYNNLIVNKLDSHPNALAHHLAAASITARVQVALGADAEPKRFALSSQ